MIIQLGVSNQEQTMEQVRYLLKLANEYERGGCIEQADAFGAMAANRLASVVHSNQEKKDGRK